jgi:hypothetical protein
MDYPEDREGGATGLMMVGRRIYQPRDGRLSGGQPGAFLRTVGQTVDGRSDGMGLSLYAWPGEGGADRINLKSRKSRQSKGSDWAEGKNLR